MAYILIVSLLVQRCLQTFPMATVAIFLNCGPLLSVMIASLFWPSEKVTLGMMIKVTAAFIGVLMITLGNPDD